MSRALTLHCAFYLLATAIVIDSEMRLKSMSIFCGGGACNPLACGWLVQRRERKILALRGGGDPDAVMKALFQAIQDSDIEEIASLVKQGADVNKVCEFIDPHLQPNALHYACFRNSTEVIEKLVELGAGVNARNKHGYAPLHYAAIMGNLEVCKTLVRLGADLNATDIFLDQPIDRAEQAECKDIVEWMTTEMANRSIARHWGGYNNELDEMREIIEDAAAFSRNQSYTPRFMTGKDGKYLPEYQELTDLELKAKRLKEGGRLTKAELKQAIKDFRNVSALLQQDQEDDQIDEGLQNLDISED